MSDQPGEALLLLVQENQRAMDRVFEELKLLHTSVGQVRERMVAIEAGSVQPQVTEVRTEVSNLRERVAILEADKAAKAEVAKSHSTLADWAFKLAPWLFVVAYVVFTQFRVVIS